MLLLKGRMAGRIAPAFTKLPASAGIPMVGPRQAVGSHLPLNQMTVSIVLKSCFACIDELFQLDFVPRGDVPNRLPCPQYS